MKQTTAIYITSELHDEKAVDAVTQAFLSSIGIEYELKGSDYSDYGTYALNLIYVRTGGTEGIFLRLLPEHPLAKLLIPDMRRSHIHRMFREAQC